MSREGYIAVCIPCSYFSALLFMDLCFCFHLATGFAKDSNSFTQSKTSSSIMETLGVKFRQVMLAINCTTSTEGHRYQEVYLVFSWERNRKGTQCYVQQEICFCFPRMWGW